MRYMAMCGQVRLATSGNTTHLSASASFHDGGTASQEHSGFLVDRNEDKCEELSPLQQELSEIEQIR